ncbi:hypothetical protein [Methylobacterium brachythecii]|uniref:Terminase n=1 Tax=Methylobacterium brachythecii TaxID=1176177 RepID=A0A7W6F940_9HYPH|nr:hypothetical protein [Methylobacterium brachythecii]MBB3905118.1 hypothetical protein [Methylobacterium brachythecii]GLS44374.1 hypothetical protein GCM10007884_23620 [Methylobacterium brachythecii]
MSDRELAIRRRLREDFEHYAPRCLRIRTKSGKIVPFTLNKAQLYIHERLEAQLRTTGSVRALILKGRQQGASTYIGGRFFWKTTHRRGVRTFILTHQDDSTAALFEMVSRYHEHCPPLVKPSTGAANAKELLFDRLDSGYKVGTAGSKAVGRGNTLQMFHGSEAGFWPHARSHASGILQAIADEDGTEVIIESTANGVGNYFHEQWRKAERGESAFQAIFVPWFWSDEYRKPAPADFVLGTDPDEQGESETDYAEVHGLDSAQMYWRRLKIADLGESLFRQEYPATAAEAFQMANTNGLISAKLVMAARKRTVEPSGPLVFGYDPAHQGGDRHALAKRRGRKVLSAGGPTGLSIPQSANYLAGEIDRDNPVKAFIDVTGGYGAGVYDILVERGYGTPGRGIVVPVNFGGAPIQDKRYSPTTGEALPGPLNRRAEIWMDSLDWLEDPAGVDLPDEDEIQADACSTGYTHNSRGQIQLWSKEKMRSMGIPSPDCWDAVALTFAEPVIETAPLKLSTSSRRRGGWQGA